MKIMLVFHMGNVSLSGKQVGYKASRRVTWGWLGSNLFAWAYSVSCTERVNHLHY